VIIIYTDSDGVENIVVYHLEEDDSDETDEGEDNIDDETTDDGDADNDTTNDENGGTQTDGGDAETGE